MTRLSGCQAEILGAMAGRGSMTAAEIAEASGLGLARVRSTLHVMLGEIERRRGGKAWEWRIKG